MRRLPITKVWVDETEVDAVRQVLESGWLVQGPRVQDFEQAVASFVGVRHAIAVNSCTSAQFIMSRIAGIGPGDEVVVPAFTWISTANSVGFVGARPVFCDIDLATFNLDLEDAARRITPRTRALYPVHLFGLAAPMPQVMELARANDLAVVEDCACSLGASIEGKHTGGDGLGGCFSFHPRKSITTGEGGMITTNDDRVADLARSLRDHGAAKTDFERHNNPGSFLLTEYALLGYNMRLTDIQGALGVVQMGRVDAILKRKLALAREFTERLASVPWLRAPTTPPGYTHGYQAYCTLFNPEEALRALAARDLSAIDRLSAERNNVMTALESRGISTRQGTHAVHIQRYYRETMALKPMDYPAAYAADRLTLALPFYPTMTSEDVDYLFQALGDVI
ncbi:MAG: DegT/DnrJ/EryC1/StrS family aminotransferase [Vicinamibacteria bacterium]